MPDTPRGASAELVSVKVAFTPLGDETSAPVTYGAAGSVRASQAAAFPRVRKKVDSFRLDVLKGYSDSTFVAVTGFNKDVSVSFRYTDDEINYWGVHEETLKVMLSTDDGATWSDLPSTIDAANKTVTAQTTVPGVFALTGVRYRSVLVDLPKDGIEPVRARR